MSSSLAGDEMHDFFGEGIYSVGRAAGSKQRSAHIYCGSDIRSLCGASNRGQTLLPGHTSRLNSYRAGELTCQKCLARYRRLAR